MDKLLEKKKVVRSWVVFKKKLNRYRNQVKF